MLILEERTRREVENVEIITEICLLEMLIKATFPIRDMNYKILMANNDFLCLGPRGVCWAESSL